MLDLIIEQRALFQAIALYGLAVMCFVYGSGPEKLAGGIFVAMSLCDKAYHLISGAGLTLVGMDVGHFAIDFSGCLALIILALLANRLYTLWIGSFQILATTAHLARELSDSISTLAYAIMYIAPSYLQILALAIGLWFHRKRVRENGKYRSWLNSSGLSWKVRQKAWRSG